ncbi:hypothetical protein GCM10010253_23620 [Streptomyces badius]|uniref:Uncharacterized protein n=1 Tax=Streptomyces badius TaxID=1941 RepID=A0ABQ2T1W2_STRBA|nr:hypothetical protein GCM10010253_23620 [Streptomyces badius]
MAGHKGRGGPPNGYLARIDHTAATPAPRPLPHISCSGRHLKRGAPIAEPASAPPPSPLGQE